jgi:beta-N-acetylhexosaminidase
MERSQIHRHARSLMTAAAVLAAALTAAVGTAGEARAATPTLAQLVGQRMVVAMAGTQADSALLARIRAGQVGGVILFSQNIVSPSQLTALTSSLQAAARAGGRPRLIIATDQEGGLVRRVPWAPPVRSAQQLGLLSPSQVTLSGSVTGAALRNLGINVDLAPVADVPAGSADFIWRQHRAFSTNRYTVSLDAAGFAQGLESGRVWPTLKHFPGLGLATVSTDVAFVRILASRTTLWQDMLPYQVAFRRGLRPLVMLSTALYPAYDTRAAAWSPRIISGLLRQTLGFSGVTISDSLNAAAVVRGDTANDLALRSAQASNDLILLTGSEWNSQAVYLHLLAAARSGALPLSQLTASYNRILALKTHL